MNTDHATKVARRVIYAVALAGVVYLFARYDTFDVPDSGCSPVVGIAPGARLILDRWARESREHDVVLFHSSDGALHLGRVVAPPSVRSTSPDEIWIGIDDARCPDFDSTKDGPVQREQIVARVLVAF